MIDAGDNTHFLSLELRASPFCKREILNEDMYLLVMSSLRQYVHEILY